MVESLLRDLKEQRLVRPAPVLMFDEKKKVSLLKMLGHPLEDAAHPQSSFAGRVEGVDGLKRVSTRVKQEVGRLHDLGIELIAVKDNNVNPHSYMVKLVVKGLPRDEDERLRRLWLEKTAASQE